jgi:hypothetical protein
MIAPKQVYPKPTERVVILYDARVPGAADRFHEERAAWQEYGDVEALDEHHYVLVVRPGGARELGA